MSAQRTLSVRRAIAVAAFLTSGLSALAQETAAEAKPEEKPDPLRIESFLRPPKAIEDLVLAPRHRNALLSNLSPDGKRFLVSVSSGLPALADLAKPYHNLGGERIDPAANRDRALNFRNLVGYDILDWQTGKRVEVRAKTPDARFTGGEWSPDGGKFVALLHEPSATRLVVVDAATGAVRVVTELPVLATLVTRPQWAAKGKKLVAVLVPNARMPFPAKPDVPVQPDVRVTEPAKNRIRTYRGLLQTAHDQQLLEYYATGQLAVIDVESGQVQKIGQHAMIKSFDASPDGKHFRVTAMQKPFSYLVPASQFPDKEEIWDESGKALAELQKRPLRLGEQQTTPTPTPTPGPGQRRGGGQGGGGQAPSDDKRSIAWRPDGAGLSFLQLEPAPRRTESGNPEEEPQQPAPQPQARRKDRVMLWTAPFGKDDAKVVFESEERIGSVQYSADCKTLFLTQTVEGTETLYAVNLAEPSKRITIYSHRPSPEAVGGPGSLMNDDNENGRRVVRISQDGRVFLSGTAYYEDPTKDAPRPFVDAVSLSNGEKKRIWQSSASVYETVSAVLDPGSTKLVLNRQSPSMQPDSWLAELKPPADDGQAPTADLKKLTSNVDYVPEITGATRERFQVTRPDGFKFWVEVTLPKWHVKGVGLPALFWFYPREFTDQRAYDRGLRTFNKNQFPSVSVSSKDMLVALGYAVVEPDCPIVGPQGRMNDAYVPDLRANLWAVIDALDRKGYIDRDRLAIGGHSYGAFSTANAMIHTPYFKAGIAGDGNYNRLLTPSAFQSEQRVLWEARETYLSMSPLLYAEQLTGALLMYHGMDDQNVGTHPINSERLYHALENLGKTAALYMYPYEDHGPASKETHLDLWARWVAWLEKYVKNAGKTQP